MSGLGLGLGLGLGSPLQFEQSSFQDRIGARTLRLRVRVRVKVSNRVRIKIYPSYVQLALVPLVVGSFAKNGNLRSEQFLAHRVDCLRIIMIRSEGVRRLSSLGQQG